ncbi:hypothetical protein ACOKW7_15575 [Limnospira platensis CENA597]|uniref:hypothetical protein n=1 Tax=Oscillatoriales TaxID=1150 RepID=UPI0029426B12|nr:hypothetical protein [Arthrospira sp. PLM2.Bin9]
MSRSEETGFLSGFVYANQDANRNPLSGNLAIIAFVCATKMRSNRTLSYNIDDA